MKLVVLIPALNEAATISAVIQGIPHSIPGIQSIQCVVINDGSTDQTATLAAAAGAEVVHNQRPFGLGRVFQKGLKLALERGAEVIVWMDGDGQFHGQNIPELVKPLVEKRAELVTCSRFLNPRNFQQIPIVRRFGNRLFTHLINLLGSQTLTDVSCGFRAMNSELAESLTLFGQFSYTHESLLLADRLGARIQEVDLPVRGTREFGRSRISSNTIAYGLRQLLILTQTVRDYSPLRFFGGLALVFLGGGGLTLGFVFAHWLQTGQTSPYKSFITVGFSAFIVGVILMVMAFIADMLGRQRRLLEVIRLEQIRSKRQRF